MSVRYVVVEGVTGVGKRQLGQKLADRMGARLEEEDPDDNPYLPLFYEEPERWGFQTQLAYLMNRFRRIQGFRQLDLFRSQVVSTCLFERDSIYARATLGEADLSLYERVSDALVDEIPRPDLVIFMQDTVENLARRIRARGRGYERALTEAYLERLSEAYTQFFFHYQEAPLLVVNVSQVDFVNRPEDFEGLLQQVVAPPTGTRYYQPTQVSV